ncbi:Alpha/beta hydrolase fold-1 [Arabidopsis thaliana x Arabidopsis arenosa]|uniref:Methylesterase n=3 Tax=Arabidopsis TaxID=3701 RepID=A0A178VDA9_ARATH|nr:Alpha/beta hydrolase fold-1 [Arabidopsis thaliana x Arabidopsis arenosa]KAG7633042.1 Alpha/beta hydrolase fold-1 [Arabidopsis suecica]OAP03764.1 MES11 [Arabidopsis thaliana]
MGNLCSLFTPPKPVKKRKPITKRQSSIGASSSGSGLNSNRWNNRVRSSSSRRDNKFEDAMIQEHALAAAAVLFRQQNGGGGSLPFDRSASQRYQGSCSKKNQLPRSSSSRSRSSTDPLLQPHQFLNQGIKLEDLETNHFVLVHGGSFGAWCWYKTIALLEEDGFKVTAIDLAGCGINSININGIASLSQYVKPLTDILEKLPIGEKVILVGHDFGGACISYAMELFPSKISKAVFLAAAMLTNGQSTLDMFSLKAGQNDLMRKAQIFIYTNGNENPPTAIDLDKSLLKDLLFNQSPSKDVALASVSMRSIPFAPVLEKLSLSDANYGSVRRYYIETLEDNAIPVTLQENMINSSPPEKVYRLKGADHAPFFSKPQALHKLLLEIARISPA